MRRIQPYKKLRINLSPLLLLVALLTNSVVCTAAALDSALITGFPDKASVSRVYSDGKIEQIEIPASQPKGGSLAYGTDLPAPSPNNKYVAFVRDNNLWVLEIEQRTTRKITATEKEKVKIAGVSITGWSWDGRRLLYYLQPAVESAEPYSSQTVGSMLFADASNFRIVDLNDDKIETITLLGRFAAWLPDGHFLLIPTGGKAWQPLWRWRPGQASPQVFVSEKADYHQVRLSRDGRSIVALAHFKHDTSEIVRIDAVSGKLTTLVPRRGAADYNWPALSPSGQKLAYFERDSHESRVISNLIVDKKLIMRSVGRGSFTWINEDTIVLRDNCALSVIGSSDGRVVSQQKVPAKNEHAREKDCQLLKSINR